MVGGNLKTELGYKILKRISIPLIKKLWIGKIEGIENIPKDGPCIIIANHSSYIDFLIIGTIFEGILKIPLYFWANLKIVNHPIFQYYAKYFKCIAVDAENPNIEFWKESVKKIRERKFICIFPEGTRSRNGKLGKFNSGYLRLASNTKTTVIPVSLSNTFNILPPSKKIPNFQKCNIKIFKPIEMQSKINKDKISDFNLDIFNKYYLDSVNL